MVTINDRNQELEERVQQLEVICEVKGHKPKIFEKIFNQFADASERHAYLEQKLSERFDSLTMRLDS